MSSFTADILTENLFRVLFEKSPGSILIKADPCFTIAAVSDDYLQVTSAKREQIIGKSFFEVFPDDDNSITDETAARNVFTRVIETREKIDVPAYRYDQPDVLTRQPRVHYWSCSNVPIHDSDGHVAYILNTVVDISEEVKAKNAAVESEKRLLLAAEATGFAIWDLSIPQTKFNFSPQLVSIFGHSADTQITLSSIRSQVHPDDMQNIVMKSYYEALVKGSYAYEARITWPDDSLHWICVKGMVLYNENKQPYQMLGTIVDITENKRDEIRKNDFIAMASHELKTPLTSLKAYIQLLEIKLASSKDAMVTTALGKALNQVNKMAALVHGFLDLSRIEPGKLQLKKQLFEVNQLIAECISDSRTISATHHLKFNCIEAMLVNADRQKISQVLNNFISNAIKYSARGSTVTLQSTIKDGYVEVSVKDEGIGIKAKDQEKIFQRFYRADNGEMRHVAGFGIGLYLSSEIIQRHKGKIWVKSEEDKGSTFYFSLPL